MERSDAAKRASRAVERIVQAREGSKAEMTSALRSYTRNDAVRFNAAYNALGPNADVLAVERLVQQINLFDPDNTPISFWRQPKAKGGHRRLCRLARESQVRQKILKAGIEASFTPGCHLFLARGRGREREARAIQSALNSGYRYGINADIGSAFQAAKPLEALRNTPLPATVIQNNLYYERRQFIHDRRKEQELGYHYDEDHHLVAGPRGLIQGAASSSIIFALLLNDLPHAFPIDVKLFVYGDDILLVAKSADECAAAGAILERCITAHPSGPFHLNAAPIHSRIGFERVGYEYRLNHRTQHVEIGPDHRAMERLRAGLRQLIAMNIRLGLAPRAGLEIAIRVFTRRSIFSNVKAVRRAIMAWADVEAAEMRCQQGG